jgi:uncharacterized protein
MANEEWNEIGKRWKEDPWLDEEELATCAKADLAEPFRGPVPTQLVSNGEFSPVPQTETQRRIEDRIRATTAEAADRLGVGRRRFLQTSGAMAASFLAMNEAFGAQFFTVAAAEVYEKAAYDKNALPKDVFILDDQLHVVRSSAVVPVAPVLRAYAQGPTSKFPVNPLNPTMMPDETGNPWTILNPALVGRPVGPENFQLIQFIKDVWLDSQTHVGVISNAPTVGGAPFELRNVEEAQQGMLVSASQGAAARKFINEVAGSQRCLLHGHLFLGKGNLHWMEYQIENNQPDSWKGYNIALAAKADTNPETLMGSWRHDDEKVAYPTWELISKYAKKMKATRPGLHNICVHKGLAPGLPPRPENGHPGDLPKVARDFPNLNFITYHSAYMPVFAGETHVALQKGKLREGVPDIEHTTLYAQLVKDLPNCYAEIGATFGMMVITFPTVCAHVLGQLLKYLGEDRILWGSDSVWWGSPQWQLEAFWRFQIPETIRQKYGYPQLTEKAKRKILGLNASRIFGISPDVRRYRAMPKDYEKKMSPDLLRLWDYPQTVADFPPQPGTVNAPKGAGGPPGGPGGPPGAPGGPAPGKGAAGPGGAPAGKGAAAPQIDDLGKMKAAYEELGPAPSNTRYGWIKR